MPSLEERLQQLQDAGVQEDVLADLRKAYDASGLRKERDDAAQRASAAQQEAQTLREAVLTSRWEEIGAKGDPTLLKFPEGFNVTDRDALRTFAIEKGFAEAQPDTPPEELQAHDRIGRAATEGTVPGQVNEARNKALRSQSEDEFWNFADESGITTRR